MMGIRRRARETALKILYAVDVAQMPVEQAIADHYAQFGEDPAVAEFANLLVRGVTKRQAEIDDAIRAASQNWRLERMARVDRNVLRSAVFELLYVPEVPKRVTLNEAIELAKRYGAEESGAFINGLLDRIASEVQKE
jgi:N utilization substance protein B